MNLNHNARVFLCLSLSPLFLSCACAPRSPAAPGQSSSPTASLPPTPLSAAGGQQAAGQGSGEVRLNPWSDAAREVLAQHCGRCHRGDLPTAVPGALAVFNLLEDPWYGRLAPKQFDGVLLRIRGTSAIDPADKGTVERFVRCARDGACEVHEN